MLMKSAILRVKVHWGGGKIIFPPFLLLTREVSHGYITVPVHLLRYTFAKANCRSKVPRGLRPIGPLLDAFGVGSDATTAKPSVTNMRR